MTSRMMSDGVLEIDHGPGTSSIDVGTNGTGGTYIYMAGPIYRGRDNYDTCDDAELTISLEETIALRDHLTDIIEKSGSSVE